MDKKLNEKIIKDMATINKEIMPDFAQKMEDHQIDMVSAIFYLSGAIRKMLGEVDDDNLREVILRYMLDEDEYEVWWVR